MWAITPHGPRRDDTKGAEAVDDRERAFVVASARPALATASENARGPQSDENAWTL